MFDESILKAAEELGIDPAVLIELRRTIYNEIGRYRKYDVDEAIECFIRKHILCIEFNPKKCRDNRFVRDIYRHYIEYVRKYKPVDCTYRRFSRTIRFFYKKGFETLANLGYLKEDEYTELDEELIRELYRRMKHIDPVGIAAYILHHKVGSLPIRRVANILIRRGVLEGYEAEAVTSLIYRVKILFNKYGLDKKI